jgi:hypothetical protein
VNDFLMAAASATAGAPNLTALELLAEAGLDVAGEIVDEQDEERTVHDSASRTAKSALTANPNRTKAPTRQEVDR